MNGDEYELAEEQRQAALQAEAEKVFKEIPSWKDDNTRHQEMDAIIEHAKAQGFSEAELRAIGGREWIALRKGWIGDGKPLTPEQREASITRAADRLKKSGKVKDAATLLQRRLERRERR